MLRTEYRWALLGLAGVLLAACGSDKAPSGNGGSSSAPPSTSAASSSAASGKPAAERVDALKKQLLTTAEVGTGYEQGTADNSAEPGPCEKPTMQSKFPNNTQVGTSFSKGTGQGPDFSTVDEIVVVFPDAATATSAYQANVDEISCKNGSVDLGGGQKSAFTIAPAQDVASAVGAEQATLWTITFDKTIGLTVTFVAALFKDTVVDFAFSNGPAAKAVPVPATVTKAGVGKLLSA